MAMIARDNPYLHANGGRSTAIQQRQQRKGTGRARPTGGFSAGGLSCCCTVSSKHVEQGERTGSRREQQPAAQESACPVCPAVDPRTGNEVEARRRANSLLYQRC